MIPMASVEAGGESDTQTCRARDQTQIMGMPYIGINVSDVEASVSFYRRFGYKACDGLIQTLSPEESAAWGFDQPGYRGADVAIDA